MLFREIFTIMVPVDDPFTSQASENLTLFSVGLHSRHTVEGDDGSFIPDEIKCLESILPPSRTAQTCAVYLMSDRPKCVEKLKAWLADENCTGVAVDPAVEKSSPSAEVTNEMGPNQGIGFFQELSLASSARTALVGNFHRSSFMLLVELIEYDRRIEDWKSGRESADTLVSCKLPDRYGRGYDYGPGTPTFRNYRRRDPLSPIQILNDYRASHSVEQLTKELENSEAKTPRSFVVGHLPCPLDSSTDKLHAFLNGKCMAGQTMEPIVD